MQRRISPPQRSHSGTSQSQIDSERPSPTLEDSQTVVISPTTTQDRPAPSTSQPQTAPPAQSKPVTVIPDDDLRKCWICFSDESEDTPQTSQWRSPCPCALTAHEACLLDWIADLEAPNSRRGRQGRAHKIECPQCKSEIIIARPRSLVIDGVRALEDTCSRAILPSVLLLSVSSIFRLFYEYGIIAVEVVMGPGDAVSILEPLFEVPRSSQSFTQHLLHSIRTGTRLSLGLVSIPPVLILSRTSIADGILPILPMLFLATSPKQDTLSDLGSWPPSAGLSFALLPYIRSAYNFYYDRVWAEKERKWLREIQPRATTAAEEGDGAGQAENNEEAEDILEEEENVIQIDVDFNIVDEWPNGEPAPAAAAANLPARGVAPPLHAPPQDDIEAIAEQLQQAEQQLNQLEAEQGIVAGDAQGDAGQEGAQPAAAAPPQPVPEQRGALALNIATNRLADTVLGALAFPFVSALTGDLLRYVLPRAWTTPSAAQFMGRKQHAFLQARWARSLVGGCLFVVLKDAVMLYVRWKMARNHRQRHVLNWDKKAKKHIR